MGRDAQYQRCALKAIGYGLLVLFFAVGVVKTCSSLADLKRPEHALKMFVRFALAKAAVWLDLMLAVFKIIQGMVSTIITHHCPRKSSTRSDVGFGTRFPCGREGNPAVVHHR